jgi:hypothetical protein
MIRIIMTEGVGGAVIVDALVNVSERRVEMLQVETDCELSRVYIAEALVALELEIEMEARRVRKPETKVILDTSKFDAALARYQEVLRRTGDGLLRSHEVNPELPALTNQDRATAMGLVPCRAEWDSSCECCDEASIDWMRREGQVLIGWCNRCLPAAFEKHLKEQADLDRLVEADDGLKPELRAEKRAEDLKCEGGCE